MIRRRRRTVALAASAMLVAALAPLGSTAIAPAIAGATPRASCADAAANGDVTVAFVIDFSGARGAPSSGIVDACVAVPSGDNDSEALAALATEKGFAAPRYNDAGLLCAIGGIPTHGCGQPVKGGYAYWSYWQGSPSGWTYASTGPAENQVNSSVVQGWRWEDPGQANPTDPQPRGPTTPRPICHPGPPPTTTTTSVSTTSPPSPGGTTARPAGTSSGLPPVSRTAPMTTAGGGAQQPTNTTKGTRVAPAIAVPVARRHGTTTSSTSPVTAGQVPTSAPAGRGGEQFASSPAGVSSHTGGGAPWLLIVLVVLVVAALAGAATYRWRRTPPT